MYVILYLDTFFGVNLVMNITILFLVQKLLKLSGKWFRILVSGIIGAVAMIAVFFSFVSWEWEKGMFFHLFLSVLMLRIAFGKTSVRGMVARLCCMYAAAFFTAGAGSFISSQVNQWELREIQGFQSVRKTGIGEILILSGIIFIFIPVILKVTEYIKQEYVTKYKVSLYYNDRMITGMALMDTGNQLKDWFTGSPVTIVEKEFIKGLLEEEDIRQIEEYQNITTESKEAVWETKATLKYIPYHSLGNENGMLVGMYLESMFFEVRGKKRKIFRPLIGIYDGSLSENREYQIILHRELVE